MTTFALKEDRVRVERHRVESIDVLVYRADDAISDGFSPYVKCAVLPAFCDWAAEHGLRALGYYASRESFWVGDLKRECDKRAIKAVITHPRTKEPPPWARAIGDSLVLLKPNVYQVNFNISRKQLFDRFAETGLMLPMGIDVFAFVDLQTKFFKRYALPKAASYIVPTGSGTALSCLALALSNKQSCTLHGVVSRPIKSVQRVIENNIAMKTTPMIELHDDSTDGHDATADDAPWPVSKGWERRAYAWLKSNISSLTQPICFVSLGR